MNNWSEIIGNGTIKSVPKSQAKTKGKDKIWAYVCAVCVLCACVHTRAACCARAACMCVLCAHARGMHVCATSYVHVRTCAIYACVVCDIHVGAVHGVCCVCRLCVMCACCAHVCCMHVHGVCTIVVCAVCMCAYVCTVRACMCLRAAVFVDVLLIAVPFISRGYIPRPPMDV